MLFEFLNYLYKNFLADSLEGSEFLFIFFQFVIVTTYIIAFFIDNSNIKYKKWFVRATILLPIGFILAFCIDYYVLEEIYMIIYDILFIISINRLFKLYFGHKNQKD